MIRSSCRSTASRLCRISLVMALLLLLSVQLSWGYAEDIQTGNTAEHSTFHYEMSRTLARAAGFSVDEAELIAVADQATDTGTFKGDFAESPTVQIEGTQRVSENGLYWHFARRGSKNATGEYTYPGERDTCAYFTRPFDRCRGGPELAEIELWAVYGRATPSVGLPQISVNGSALQPVAGRSLPALALYLHALADSYSHEACMKSEEFRGHKPSPPECNATTWHQEAEYGPDPSRDLGVPYTKEAGWAT